MEDNHREYYESRRLKYQKMYETALHSDKIAADIGIYCLKVLLVVTGGAIIALLSFLTSDSSGSGTTRTIISGALDEFLWALVLAGGASGVAYFYQSFVTRKEWEELSEDFNKNYNARKWPRLFSGITATLMMILSLSSFIIFCYASFSLVGDFQSLGINRCN